VTSVSAPGSGYWQLSLGCVVAREGIRESVGGLSGWPKSTCPEGNVLGRGGAPPGVIPLNLGVLARASRNMWLFVYWSYRSGG